MKSLLSRWGFNLWNLNTANLSTYHGLAHVDLVANRFVKGVLHFQIQDMPGGLAFEVCRAIQHLALTLALAGNDTGGSSSLEGIHHVAAEVPI